MAQRYKISIRGDQGNQLPTLIMFEKGKESGRLPHVYSDGKVASGKFRRHDIVTAFALEERAAGDGTMKKSGGGGGGGGGKMTTTTVVGKKENKKKK